MMEPPKEKSTEYVFNLLQTRKQFELIVFDLRKKIEFHKNHCIFAKHLDLHYKKNKNDKNYLKNLCTKYFEDVYGVFQFTIIFFLPENNLGFTSKIYQKLIDLINCSEWLNLRHCPREIYVSYSMEIFFYSPLFP